MRTFRSDQQGKGTARKGGATGKDEDIRHERIGSIKRLGGG